jgi:hypothetical protein
MKRFTVTLDTQRQIEFMGIVLNTAIDILHNGKNPFVRERLPVGWQDILASEESKEVMTRMLDTMLDRMAIHEEENKEKEKSEPSEKKVEQNGLRCYITKNGMHFWLNIKTSSGNKTAINLNRSLHEYEHYSAEFAKVLQEAYLENKPEIEKCHHNS